jgi:hypothetical protein
MKKDELVHLHSLLTVVRAEYERRGVVSSSAFGSYEELGVSPMAVYGSKSEHARAVQALASTLAAASDDSVRSEPTHAESTVSESRTERDEHGERNVTVQS